MVVCKLLVYASRAVHSNAESPECRGLDAQSVKNEAWKLPGIFTLNFQDVR